MPGRLHGCADDDGGPRVPRASDPGKSRQNSGRVEITPVMSAYDDKMNLVVFEPLKLERSWTLDTYRKIGGYEIWEKLLREKPPREQIIDAVKASGLRGRG